MGKAAPPESGLAIGNPPASDLLKFIWPVDSRRISTRFSAWHQAIDIDEFPAGGNPVRVTADGIVTYAGGQACCSYGLYVIVAHANGFSSLYSHLSSLEVKQGQAVKQGQELGRSGCTGRCTGPHLHFAIYYDHAPLDPLGVLPAGASFEPGSY
jgi:murein DD-endopeptidase MepM/ murein hydrolase activator NlpD